MADRNIYDKNKHRFLYESGQKTTLDSGFETGTVGSGKKPSENVLRGRNIGIAGVTTLPARELLTLAVSPIDMVAGWTRLAGIERGHGAEGNTVILAPLLEPRQPIPNVPATDRSTHIFGQAPFDLSIFGNALQVFDNDQVGLLDNLFSYLINSLAQGSASTLLALTPMFTSFDPLNTSLNIGSELLTGVETSQDVDAGIHTNSGVDFFLRSRLDLVGELYVVASDNVPRLPTTSGFEFLKMTMRTKRQIEDNLLADRIEVQPEVETGSILGGFQVGDGRRASHTTTTVNRLYSFIAPSFDRRIYHVHSLTSGYLAKAMRDPSLWRIYDRGQDGRLRRRYRPKDVNKEINHTPILYQHAVERRPFRGGGEAQRAFSRALDSHDEDYMNHTPVCQSFLFFLRHKAV